MISLRLRLAFVLLAAIVTVVAASVALIILFDDGPEDGSSRAAFARSLHVTARLLEGSAERARAAGLTVGPEPAPAAIDPVLTRELRDELRRGGLDEPELAVTIAGPRRDAAFRLGGDAWVTVPYRSRTPSPQTTLLFYFTFIVVGTTLVALAAASRVMGPLRMLEAALATVRPDGTLAPVPEDRGPPEVRRTARTLNTLSDRLRTAMESRMRLVAAAGHDLRTPMTRMRLRAEFLPDEERATWLRDLGELDRIADSAIRLVREETDAAAFETCSLAELVRRVVADVGEIGLPAAFAPGPDAAVRGQPFALERALRNLVENAARHGGGASVRLETTGADARVVIEDRGPGIPEALLDRVFEPFFRVGAGRRKTHAGAGLGLAIAREIVERHGGRLTIRNRADGGGLRQEVALPRAAVDPSLAVDRGRPATA